MLLSERFDSLITLLLGFGQLVIQFLLSFSSQSFLVLLEVLNGCLLFFNLLIKSSNLLREVFRFSLLVVAQNSHISVTVIVKRDFFLVGGVSCDFALGLALKLLLKSD